MQTYILTKIDVRWIFTHTPKNLEVWDGMDPQQTRERPPDVYVTFMTSPLVPTTTFSAERYRDVIDVRNTFGLIWSLCDIRNET